jgi:hypothetical protein
MIRDWCRCPSLQRKQRMEWRVTIEMPGIDVEQRKAQSS